jgi:hypothetical protein
MMMFARVECKDEKREKEEERGGATESRKVGVAWEKQQEISRDGPLLLSVSLIVLQ